MCVQVYVPVYECIWCAYVFLFVYAPVCPRVLCVYLCTRICICMYVDVFDI